jgi:hypothetical protein
LAGRKASKHCSKGEAACNIQVLAAKLYANDDEIISVIKRANFKIEVQNIQDENKILVDIDQCQKT